MIFYLYFNCTWLYRNLKNHFRIHHHNNIFFFFLFCLMTSLLPLACRYVLVMLLLVANLIKLASKMSSRSKPNILKQWLFFTKLISSILPGSWWISTFFGSKIGSKQKGSELIYWLDNMVSIGWYYDLPLTVTSWWDKYPSTSPWLLSIVKWLGVYRFFCIGSMLLQLGVRRAAPSKSLLPPPP